MKKEDVQYKFNTDLRWLLRGLVAVYDGQDRDERNDEDVKRHNRRGFKPQDAKFLCSVAGNVTRGLGLTPKQIAVTKRKMQKYAGQCLDRAKRGVEHRFDVKMIDKSIAECYKIEARFAARQLI